MNGLKKKLNSGRGASMLIALIYLLTALMVGTVVLTAAASNVGRITHNRRDQREYYAVESAMELVRQDLKDAALSGSYQKTVTRTYHPEQTDDAGNVTGEAYTSTAVSYGGLSAAIRNSDILAAQEADFKKLYGSSVPEETGLHESAPSEMKYELQLSASKEMPEVKGVLTVNTDTYDIDVELWTADEDDSSVKSNPVTMRFTACRPATKRSTQSYSRGNEDTTKITCMTTVAWDEESISKGVRQ